MSIPNPLAGDDDLYEVIDGQRVFSLSGLSKLEKSPTYSELDTRRRELAARQAAWKAAKDAVGGHDVPLPARSRR